MSVLVIAEAGVNHNGDLDLARALIDSAQKAGADLVKFQIFHPDRIVRRGTPTAGYQEAVTGESDQHGMLASLALSTPQFRELAAYADSRGIGFLATAFDLDALQLALELQPGIIKIASPEITNLPLLRASCSRSARILLSTGMSTLAEVERAVDVLVANGTLRSDIVVLQCTSAYPAPVEDVNLRAMVSMGGYLDVTFGYSDHTLGIEVALAAVALGASVIEKHLTLDQSLPGPDHAASLLPEGFEQMVGGIRKIDEALGSDEKTPTVSELVNRSVVRRALCTSRALDAGAVITSEDVIALRPEAGICPFELDDVVGKTLVRDLEAFAPIAWDDLKQTDSFGRLRSA